jgi:hypothetical protein
MTERQDTGASLCDRAGRASIKPASGLDQKATIPCADTQFLMGLRIGLRSALAVTHQLDDYTKARISALIIQAESR